MEILQLTKIEEEIKLILEQVCFEWHHKELYGDTNWTRRIKELFFLKGEEFEYEVCASGIGCAHGEWLYDLVWYENNEEGLLKSVPLVVESEWGRSYSHIKYDFEKLLLANAEHRLMICQSGKYQIEDIMEYFHKAVQAYSALQSGERFLIAFLDDHNSEEFLFRLIVKE